MKKVIAFILLIFGIFVLAGYAYIAFSQPNVVAFEQDGSVVGVTNKMRESIQGYKFWENQLRLVRSRLRRELSAPERQAIAKQYFDAQQESIDRKMEEFHQEMEEVYQKYPDWRPSQAQQEADALREKADEIEQTESDAIMEKYRLIRISELRQLLPVAEAKAVANQ